MERRETVQPHNATALPLDLAHDLPPGVRMLLRPTLIVKGEVVNFLLIPFASGTPNPAPTATSGHSSKHSLLQRTL